MARPTWQELAMERVTDSIEARRSGFKDGHRAAWGHNMTLRVTKEFMALIHEAASERGITVGAYMRRSIAKQLSADLPEIPIDLILHFVPAAGKYGAKGTGPYGTKLPKGVMSHDDGKGFGDWGWQ